MKSQVLPKHFTEMEQFRFNQKEAGRRASGMDIV